MGGKCGEIEGIFFLFDINIIFFLDYGIGCFFAETNMKD